MTKQADDAVAMFLEGYNCAQSVLATLGQQRGLDKDTAIKVAQAFGGGVARTGSLCGALGGGLMALGLSCSASSGADSAAKAKAYDIARAIMAEFARRHGSLLCRELTGCDLTTEEGTRRFKEIDAHHTICTKLVADAVEIVQTAISKP